MKYLLVVILACLSVPAVAQVEELEARVGTISCAACFNLAIAGLKQTAGVADVTGDMNNGWIRVGVNGKQGISLKDAMERIRVAGFQDGGQFTLIASGVLEQRGNKLVLVVPNQKEVFVVDPGDRAQMAENSAASRSAVRATGQLSGGGNQYDLKIQKLQKQ